MKIKPLVIFDIDGVLIDVSGSYREVVRLSVFYYLRDVLGARELREEFITLSDVASVKKSGGLNNDWDLTYAILDFILKNYFEKYNNSFIEDFKKISLLGEDSGVLKALQELREKLDFSTLYREFSSSYFNNFIKQGYFSSYASKICFSPFILNNGDVKSGNIIKRLFQELYLGQKLFTEIYGENPLIYNGKGFIEKERLIPTIKELEELSSLCILAIATGRPGIEAHYALQHFRIEKIFKVVVTEDDIIDAEKKKGESLRKPHPYILERCIELCGGAPPSGVWYVGDMPDDILAARRACIYPFGFVSKKYIKDPEEALDHRLLLLEMGAHRVFGNFQTLIGFFKRFPV